MPNIALITGASSGIGREFARIHAARGGDVILVARREDALMALKSELEAAHNITAHVLAQDLGGAEAAMYLYNAVKSAGHRVDILINNAGFGGHGEHLSRDLGEEQAMIDLNISALVVLTHAFGRDMVAQGGGKILNVGSTAGFFPGPLQAVYFATKAFVVSYSQAIDFEMRPKGVSCTVLAPGYVATEFAKVANLEGTDLVKGGGATANSAALAGYNAMIAGRSVIISDAFIKFSINWLFPFVPRKMVLSIIAKMQTK
jgi:short-subunit dehydrogenase